MTPDYPKNFENAEKVYNKALKMCKHFKDVIYKQKIRLNLSDKILFFTSSSVIIIAAPGNTDPSLLGPIPPVIISAT